MLGMRPTPAALLIAFAILRWFTGRSPVSEECLIRPMGVTNSDMIEKFCSPVNIGLGLFGRFYRNRVSARLTLYSLSGFKPSTSKASRSGFCRFRHLIISTEVRSCGA